MFKNPIRFTGVYQSQYYGMEIRVLFQCCLIAFSIADENAQRGRKKGRERRMAVYRDSEQIENRYLKSLRKVPWQERIIYITIIYYNNTIVLSSKFKSSLKGRTVQLEIRVWSNNNFR